MNNDQNDAPGETADVIRHFYAGLWPGGTATGDDARRVLGALRSAISVTDIADLVDRVRAAPTDDAAACEIVATLSRIERTTALELATSVPNLLDAFRLPSGACWLLPRDPLGVPLFWDDRRQRFEREARADRDWMISNLVQTLGAGWRKQRAQVFENPTDATAWARAQARIGRDDVFERALAAETGADRDADSF